MKQNSLKTVVSTKTAVKRFSCFSQSQPVSAVYAKLLSNQTVVNKLGDHI